MCDMIQGGHLLDTGQINEQMGMQQIFAEELTNSPHWLNLYFQH